MERDLVRLQHIIAVARERRFGRAAAQLRISQPALSRSIKTFEDKHDVRLFDRGRGGVMPTAAGAQVIREAEKILRGLRELHHNIRLFSAQGSGLIRIVIVPMLSTLILPRLGRLALMGEHHALLEAVIPPLEQLPALLLDERNEMAFCSTHTAVNRPGLIVEPIGTVLTAAIVRAGHPLCRRENVLASDLTDFPILCVTDLSDSRTDSRVGGMICSDMAVLRQCALDTDAVWITFPGLVAADLAAGRLKQIEVDSFEFRQSEICVVYHEGRTLSRLGLAMIEEARDVLAESDSHSKARSSAGRENHSDDTRPSRWPRPTSTL